MPQFDFYSFSTQIFWVLLGFIVLYFFLLYFYLIIFSQYNKLYSKINSLIN